MWPKISKTTEKNAYSTYQLLIYNVFPNLLHFSMFPPNSVSWKKMWAKQFGKGPSSLTESTSKNIIVSEKKAPLCPQTTVHSLELANVLQTFLFHFVFVIPNYYDCSFYTLNICLDLPICLQMSVITISSCIQPCLHT